MSQSIAKSKRMPVDELDPEVLAFREQFEDRSSLDQIIHQGAQQMLQAAIDSEVKAFIERHGDRRDEQGRRLVVRNGTLPSRSILTGAGSIEVKQGRVRDNSSNRNERVQFTPSVLPAYLRRTTAISSFLPSAVAPIITRMHCFLLASSSRRTFTWMPSAHT
jgi:putative transposase